MTVEEIKEEINALREEEIQEIHEFVVDLLNAIERENKNEQD